MHCANCQTEIADNALICYRCGRATGSPAKAAAPVTRDRRGRVGWLIVAWAFIAVASVVGWWLLRAR